MGVFGFFKGLAFRKKKQQDLPQSDIGTKQTSYMPSLQTERAGSENLKEKMDLMMAQMDSLKLEYEAINQRIQNIERMVREIYMMAKS